MLSITVRFLHGTVRTGSPDDTVMAGGDPTAEWPPSPARLHSAFVASDGTGTRCRVTTGEELSVLEALGPPEVLADTAGDLAFTDIPHRFVVVDQSQAGQVQNYPGRTSREVRPGRRVSPRTPAVEYRWDTCVDPAVVEALKARAARIGYLGCADSPVQVSVAEEPSLVPSDTRRTWQAGTGHGVALPVAYQGFTAALDGAFDTWCSGKPMRRSWVPTEWASYTEHAGEQVEAEPTVVWLELDRRVDPRRSLALTEILRAAVLAQVDAATAGDGRSAHWLLHGHDVPAGVPRPYQLVRFLALGNVGYRRSDGAVHGAAIWFPPDTDVSLVSTVRTVIATRLRRLDGVGVHVGVRLLAETPGKWSISPSRWRGPARRWFSVTPAVAERGRRGGPTVGDVRSWFEHAGHPVPAQVLVSPVPTVAGVARLRSGEVHREGRDRHPYVWVEVEFPDPVAGPLCVGRSRSLGMGLLAPLVRRGR